MERASETPCRYGHPPCASGRQCRARSGYHHGLSGVGYDYPRLRVPPQDQRQPPFGSEVRRRRMVPAVVMRSGSQRKQGSSGCCSGNSSATFIQGRWERRVFQHGRHLGICGLCRRMCGATAPDTDRCRRKAHETCFLRYGKPRSRRLEDPRGIARRAGQRAARRGRGFQHSPFADRLPQHDFRGDLGRGLDSRWYMG